MNAKISLTDLAAIIAEDTGYDYATCEKFLKGLFATVADTLIAGENVKIKGIGTFKLTEVDQRKSVNVNTGEEMLIPGHRKVSFTPDKSMAEAVNTPFAMFEPVELADNVSEEMLDIESEISVSDTASEELLIPETAAETPDATTIKKENIINPTAQATEYTATPRIKTDSTEDSAIDTDNHKNQSESASRTPLSNQDTQGQTHDSDLDKPTVPPATDCLQHEERITKVKIVGPVITQQEVPVSPGLSTPEVNRPVGKSLFRKGIVIGFVCAICIILICIAAWRLLMPDSFIAATSALLPDQNPKIAQQHTVRETTPRTLPANTVTDETTRSNEVADTTESSSAKEQSSFSDTKEDRIQLPEVLSDEDKQTDHPTTQDKTRYDKISKTRYLTTMAREYYGNYNLWPYIYDANKGLGHPDRIRPGTKIRIPSTEELGIDPTDPVAIRKAKNRGVQIYNQYRK